MGEKLFIASKLSNKGTELLSLLLKLLLLLLLRHTDQPTEDCRLRLRLLSSIYLQSSVFLDIMSCSPLKVNPSVSEEHVTSIFRVEE
jgi:hypothetical protein